MNGTLLFLIMGILLTGGVVLHTPVFGELSYENMIETVTDDLNSFRGNEHLTKPTFGVSHGTSANLLQKNHAIESLHSHHPWHRDQAVCHLYQPSCREEPPDAPHSRASQAPLHSQSDRLDLQRT